jgi:protease IV
MNFLKIVFGSCLGVILGLILISILSVFLVAGIVSMSGNQQSEPLEKASFLEIRSDRTYPEKTDNIADAGFSLKNDKVIGLHDLIAAIEHAKTDEKIKGILFRSMYSSLPPASASTLHHALKSFRESGKPVIAYADAFSEGSYYIASAADKIMLNPNGTIDLKGFGTMMPFFKEMLDKIGVHFDIYYAGQFKSATEPFRLDKMSDQNRQQTREYLEDLYREHLDDISAARNMPASKLRNISNEFLIRQSKDAISYGLVDTLGYLDDLYAYLGHYIPDSKKEKPEIVSINRYFDSPGVKAFVSGSNDKLAVVFAEGDIVDGEGAYGQIGSAKYTRILRKIRFDSKVKAVVLRVNSPGGSSLASDNILHEIDLIKKAGKPVVVSMGDYAASGGYYIACHADSIFAQANTITGSIGVFFMIPNVSKLMDEKIGINWDTVQTGKYSNSFTPLLPWTSAEGIIAQQSTDQIYGQFLEVVAAGRKKSVAEVHAIAQGRVWSGKKAVENGLVDQLGDLSAAINSARRQASLGDKIKIVEYPAVKEPLLKMIEDITGSSDTQDEKILQRMLKSWYPIVSFARNTETNQYKPLMRLPYVLKTY